MRRTGLEASGILRAEPEERRVLGAILQLKSSKAQLGLGGRSGTAARLHASLDARVS